MKPIEPFGFFRAEPFGWTNCAETDDGAAPLYDQAAIDGLVKQRDELVAVFEEQDPHGLGQHAPGAKLDAGKVRPDLILSGMPRALLAVARVATFGAEKYTENGWREVPDGVQRYTAALDRHRLQEGIELADDGSGLPHAAHLAWNALARLELMLLEADSWKGGV